MSCCYEHYQGDEYEKTTCLSCREPITVIHPWNGFLWDYNPDLRNYLCEECEGSTEQRKKAKDAWDKQLQDLGLEV